MNQLVSHKTDVTVTREYITSLTKQQQTEHHWNRSLIYTATRCCSHWSRDIIGTTSWTTTANWTTLKQILDLYCH